MVVGNPMLDIGVFAVLVVATSAVALRVGRRDHAAPDHDPSFGGPRNGVPIAAEQLGAVAFLGIVGAVAVYGHEGFGYAVGFLGAWLIALLLIAELVRNPGRFAGAEALSVRLRGRPVRTATATATLAVSFFALLAQTVAAATLVELLLRIPAADTLGRVVSTAVTGAVVVAYVLVGGMRTTPGARIAKAGSLLLVVAVLLTWVMGTYGWNVSALLDAAAAAGRGTASSAPPAGQVLIGLSNLDLLSSALALVLGVGGLPHVLRRLSAATDVGRTRRRSVLWSVGLFGLFGVFCVLVGYGGATLVPGGAPDIAAAPGASNAAAPLLVYQLGGGFLLALVSAVAFATILDAAAGLTITASVAFAHEVHAGRVRPARSAHEVRVARRTAVFLVITAAGVGLLARNENVSLLLSLAFAVAASANLPTLLLSLFWRRFTDQGAQWSSYGGLTCSVVLILVSPVVWGQRTSMFPGVHLALFPLANPALVSIPVSFLLGVAATCVGVLRRARTTARIAARQAALDRDPPTEAIPYDPVGRVRAARQVHGVWPTTAEPAQEAFTRPLPQAGRQRSGPPVPPGPRHERPRG